MPEPRRSIKEVIDRVILELPPYDPYFMVKQDLEEIIAWLPYLAPELKEGPAWRKLAMVLSYGLPEDSPTAPEWCQKIGRIIRAEE